jgi:ATP-dependent RNA helicase DDX52/ROK1
MDPFKLLSRSTKLKSAGKRAQDSTPSSGQNAQPQLFAQKAAPSHEAQGSKKRKRGSDGVSTGREATSGLDFFGGQKSAKPAKDGQDEEDESMLDDEETGSQDIAAPRDDVRELSTEERKAILRQHKLKVTWLNPRVTQKRKGKDRHASKAKLGRPQLFPLPLRSFSELRTRYAIPHALAANIESEGYTVPTEVQLGSLPLLLDKPEEFSASDTAKLQPQSVTGDIDLLTVAPTGSGKTLAFLIPLLHKIHRSRQRNRENDSSISAVVLAPTKELAGQITNEGRKLAKGTGLRITQMRKGLRLSQAKPDTDKTGQSTVVKADILVSTPGTLHSMLDGQSSEKDALSSVKHLVLDEADVLLDPLFREQTLGSWNALSNPALHVSLWSATMGSNIEELAQSTINARRKQLMSELESEVPEAPLVRLVVGLKDSAVPNVDHQLVYAATEQGKLMGLRQLLHPSAAPVGGSSAALRPPFIVFTQTIERAVALHSELRYDIPAEAGGISRIAVLHSDLSDIARDSVMTRFRKGEIWVLITTDLLSRGVDFRGVNGVVNYDIPTSSAAYVHRVGRTGRAGRTGGVAVTLYSKEDIPYMKHVANVVAMAQRQKGASDGGGLDRWLLDVLPKLSKQEKHKLKKRGIESRTSRGKETDPRAARKARISSKAGFVRRVENNRKGAILGSQRRAQAAADDDGDETDF